MTLRLALMFVFVSVALNAQAPAKRKPAETPAERAARIHKEAIVVDTHIDTTMMLGREGWDFMVRHSPVKGEDSNHVDLPRAKEGGLDAAFFSIYMPGTITGPEAVKRSLILIDHVRSLAEQHPNEIVLATTAADVRAAHKAGKFAALMGMEGGHMIDDSLEVLRDYQRLGVRYLTLSHSVNTNWSDSSGDTPKHNGLTDFGKDVVRELNRLGMLVDLAHVSPATMSAALNVSRAPVIFSHSAARAMVDVARNIPDSNLRRVPANGGIVMIPFVTGFVSPQVAAYDRALAAAMRDARTRIGNDTAALRAAGDQWKAAHQKPRATLGQVADQIEYVKKIVGADHIGIGGDFDGIDDVVLGLEDVSKYPDLFAELVRRGWPDGDLRKLAGENLLRVLADAERVSRKMRAEADSPATVRSAR